MKKRVVSEELNLEDLQQRYELRGEGEIRGGARVLLGRRIEDGTEVDILVIRAPQGSDSNALTHYAADARNLENVEPHRAMVPILDQLWVGHEALALVVPRVTDRTLAEILESGEELSFPRIASILRDINGLLEWAREHRIVHRQISTEQVFVEPGTDRVRALFAIDPSPMDGGVPASEDARMIASLAWKIITRGRDLPDENGPSLATLRPQLSARVAAETDALLSRRSSPADVPRVDSYIATVGMADALLRGEVEAAHLQAELLEEQRQLREHWEAENAACHAWAAEQARELEEERDRLNRQIEAQKLELEAARTEFERAMAEERAAMAAERAAHEKAMADERQQLEIERAQLELSVAAVPEQVAEGDDEARRAVAAAVPLTPEVLDALAEDSEPPPASASTLRHPVSVPLTGPRRRVRPGWIATGVGATVLALALATAALTYGRSSRSADVEPLQQPATVAAPVDQSASDPLASDPHLESIVDSIAGSVGSTDWHSAEPAVPVDPGAAAPTPRSAIDRNRTGTTPGTAAPEPARRETPEPPRQETPERTPRSEPAFIGPPSDLPARTPGSAATADTSARRTPVPGQQRDTTAIRPASTLD